MSRGRQTIREGVLALGLPDNAEFLEKLDIFVSELMKWNQTYNLTAIRDQGQIISHHLLDSLVIHEYVTGESVIDVGSGGGFPGIPLALYFPRKNFTLLDSNGKKTRFLQQMKIALQLNNCTIVQSRSEDFDARFEQVMCRAFASLADITRKTAHLLMHGGEILALKGRLEEEETGSSILPFRVDQIYDLKVPGLNAERHLVVLSEMGQ